MQVALKPEKNAIKAILESKAELYIDAAIDISDEALLNSPALSIQDSDDESDTSMY